MHFHESMLSLSDGTYLHNPHGMTQGQFLIYFEVSVVLLRLAAKEPNPPYYLPISEVVRRDGFMPYPRALERRKT